jgi:hypothetical protein
MTIGVLQVVYHLPNQTCLVTTLINLDDEEEADNDDDSEPEQVTPTNLRLRGKRAAGPIYNKERNRRQILDTG